MVPDGHRVRPRAGGAHPRARSRAGSASGRSRRKSPRWCGTPSATSRARSSRSARRFRSTQFDPDSRRDLVTLAHRVQDAIGRSYKVLPTALVAAVMRPQHDPQRARRAPRRAAWAGWPTAGANLSAPERHGRPPTKASSGWSSAACSSKNGRTAARPRSHRPALLRAHDSSTSSRRRAARRTEDVPTRCSMRCRRRPFPCWPAAAIAEAHGLALRHARTPAALRGASSPARPSAKRSPPHGPSNSRA